MTTTATAEQIAERLENISNSWRVPTKENAPAATEAEGKTKTTDGILQPAQKLGNKDAHEGAAREGHLAPRVLEAITSRVRTDVHWEKLEKGTKCIKKPLTAKLIERHLNGGLACGCCPIKPGESTTRLALYDLDSHKGETPWSEMQRIAQSVIDALEQAGMRPVAFRSTGGKGVHIFLLWDEPQDAASVRAFMAEVLGTLDYCNGTQGVAKGEIEIFPKQDAVPDDGFGNMFILPLAGKSAPLDNITGQPEPMGKKFAEVLDWRTSPDVPVIEHKERKAALECPAPSVELKKLHAALSAIPNSGSDELNYDVWRNVVFAIHYETGGSAEGLQLAHELSARADKYDSEFLDNTVWPYIKQKRTNPITSGTVFKLAKDYGWNDVCDVEFSIISPTPEAPLPLPNLTRTKNGDILSTNDNVTKVLRRPEVCGYRVGFDAFRDELMLAQEGTEEWRAFADADYTRISILLERLGFKTIGSDLMRNCVRMVAEEHRFDSAVLWLNSLEWDGEPRVEHFLTTYACAEASPYTLAVSRYLFTAMAGRVLVPGIKADMVPVLVGPQGTAKSSAVEALVPAREHFVEISFHEDESTLARKMRGRLLGEIGELRGLRTKELESIKAFITRTHENWVPKWQEFAKVFPRRLVFLGTTNTEEFLADETGNRRWLPVRVGQIDIEAIRRDRLQLWAEARELFKVLGVAYQEAEQLAPAMHKAHMITDAWEVAIGRWLSSAAVEFATESENPETNGDRPFRLGDVLTEALHLSSRDQDPAKQQRAGRVLRAMGYTSAQMTVRGERGKWWFKEGA